MEDNEKQRSEELAQSLSDDLNGTDVPDTETCPANTTESSPESLHGMNDGGDSSVSNHGKHYASMPRTDQEEEGQSNTQTDDKRPIASKNRRIVYVAAGAAALIAVICALFSTHIICFHENWAEATCEEPRHCVDCGKTEGDPLGHEWIAATCSDPKTCMRCGATEGEAIGHKTNGWSEPTTDIVSAQEKSTLKCEVCGEIVDEKSTDLASFVKDGKFIFSPSDFCKRFRDIMNMEAIDGSDAEIISYAIVDGTSSSNMCAMLSFSSMDGQTNLGDACKYDSSCNPSPVLMVDTEKTNSAEMLVGFIQACDPSLSRSDAINVSTSLAASVSGVNGSTEKNGIEYLMAGIDYRILFRAVIK